MIIDLPDTNLSYRGNQASYILHIQNTCAISESIYMRWCSLVGGWEHPILFDSIMNRISETGYKLWHLLIWKMIKTAKFCVTWYYTWLRVVKMTWCHPTQVWTFGFHTNPYIIPLGYLGISCHIKTVSSMWCRKNNFWEIVMDRRRINIG